MDKEPVTSKKWSILGGVLALSSSLGYTFYGLLIKEFDLNFIDNMFFRSVLQILLVGTFFKLRGKSLLLEFQDHVTKKDKIKKYTVLFGQGTIKYAQFSFIFFLRRSFRF